MNTVLVVGVGAVGARATRQLVETPGIDRVLVTDRREERAREVAAAMGKSVTAVDWHAGDSLPDEVDAVACGCNDDGVIANDAVTAGVPLASAADDHDTLGVLRELDSAASGKGITVAVGAGLAPGLTDVLARHAASSFDEIDEIHVARCGTAGPACVRAVRRELSERSRVWRDEWIEERRAPGHELVWFPDPIGARECQVASSGLPLLVEAFPTLRRATFRLAEPPPRHTTLGIARAHDDHSWGAARVEVWGRRGSTRETVVYGVIERTDTAAGTVLALSVAALLGVLPLGTSVPGVHGLAKLVDPVRFLGELARRGVKAAVFEGVGAT